MSYGVRRSTYGGLFTRLLLRHTARMTRIPMVRVTSTPWGQGILVSSDTACALEVMFPPASGRPLWSPCDGADVSLSDHAVPAIGDSQHCALFAVDIAQFTRPDRDDEVQLALRDALYRLLTGSFDCSGIPWTSCVHEDRGDGTIVIIPAHMSAITIVSGLVDQIRTRLRRYNRLASEVAKLRLRLAVHIGEVHRDQHGLAGEAVNHLFRILDAPDLRERLRSPDTELALIVSDYLYRSVIDGAPGSPESSGYSEVTVVVKQFRARAWILGAPP